MDALLAQLSTTVPAARTLEQLTRPLLDMLGQITGLESTFLTTIDLTAGAQQVVLARNEGTLQVTEQSALQWIDSPCRRALDEDLHLTSDAQSQWPDCPAARLLGMRTFVTSPVRSESGELLGTLCGASSRSIPVDPAALEVLELFSTLIGHFLQRERLLSELQSANEQLAQHALTDALTGLPNRRALFDELQRLLQRTAREGRCVLVGCIDLDGFKSINDRHGHHMGDQFLQEIAQRLSLELRGSDMLARIGGDEFVVVGPGPQVPGASALLTPVLTGGDAQQVARTLEQRAALATVGRFELGAQVLNYAGASVGVVALLPAGLTAEDALQLADARMYEVKRARRKGIELAAMVGAGAHVTH